MGGDYAWIHDGGLPGTRALAAKAPRGGSAGVITVAFLFNGSPAEARAGLPFVEYFGIPDASPRRTGGASFF